MVLKKDLIEKKFKRKNFGCNEVCYTNALTLLAKIMLCSKLDCIEVFQCKPFFYKILAEPFWNSPRFRGGRSWGSHMFIFVY